MQHLHQQKQLCVRVGATLDAAWRSVRETSVFVVNELNEVYQSQKRQLGKIAAAGIEIPAPGCSNRALACGQELRFGLGLRTTYRRIELKSKPIFDCKWVCTE